MDINSDKKILFLINAGLGDVCHAMPILFALYEKYPSIKVELLFASKSAEELTRLFFHQVTGIIASELNTLFRKIFQIIRWRRARFYYVISGAHFDSPKTSLIARAVRAKQSVGMRRERYSFLYDLPVTRLNGKHVFTDYAALFQHVGISDTDIESGKRRFHEELGKIARSHRRPHLSAEPYRARIAFVNGADTIIRGRWKPSLKRIPNSSLLGIFKGLKQDLSTQFILLGVDEDTFPDEMKSDGEVIDLRGKTDIVDLITILHEADFLVCNDTGTMHLAHFCGTPYVALFGPTDAEIFAPEGLQVNIVQAHGACAPCQFDPICSAENCDLFEHVQVDRVVRLATDILSGKVTCPPDFNPT